MRKGRWSPNSGQSITNDHELPACREQRKHRQSTLGFVCHRPKTALMLSWCRKGPLTPTYKSSLVGPSLSSGSPDLLPLMIVCMLHVLDVRCPADLMICSGLAIPHLQARPKNCLLALQAACNHRFCSAATQVLDTAEPYSALCISAPSCPATPEELVPGMRWPHLIPVASNSQVSSNTSLPRFNLSLLSGPHLPATILSRPRTSKTQLAY